MYNVEWSTNNFRTQTGTLFRLINSRLCPTMGSRRAVGQCLSRLKGNTDSTSSPHLFGFQRKRRQILCRRRDCVKRTTVGCRNQWDIVSIWFCRCALEITTLRRQVVIGGLRDCVGKVAGDIHEDEVGKCAEEMIRTVQRMYCSAEECEREIHKNFQQVNKTRIRIHKDFIQPENSVSATSSTPERRKIEGLEVGTPTANQTSDEHLEGEKPDVAIPMDRRSVWERRRALGLFSTGYVTSRKAWG